MDIIKISVFLDFSIRLYIDRIGGYRLDLYYMHFILFYLKWAMFPGLKRFSLHQPPECQNYRSNLHTQCMHFRIEYLYLVRKEGSGFINIQYSDKNKGLL